MSRRNLKRKNAKKGITGGIVTIICGIIARIIIKQLELPNEYIVPLAAVLVAVVLAAKDYVKHR